jgi:hypothetical protein
MFKTCKRYGSSNKSLQTKQTKLINIKQCFFDRQQQYHFLANTNTEDLETYRVRVMVFNAFQKYVSYIVG